MPIRRIWTWFWAGLAAVALAAILACPAMSLWWGWRASNVLTEAQEEMAEEGCADCHLPAGGVEIPNPGSRWGTVPSLWGGNLMMYAKTPQQVEEYIRFGHLKDKEPPADQLVRMPAFGSRLDDGEIRGLRLLFWMANGMHVPDEGPVAKGYELALKNGCFSCHGVAGSGGRPNPGSLKGTIPGWLGPDFKELVRTDAELAEWIRTGTVKRLEAVAAARFFFRRQAIHMPAYGTRLTEQELKDLMAYLDWQRGLDLNSL